MNIYVGNLSRQAGENDVRTLFANYGEIRSVKIIKDNISGESRGFAFVDMPDEAAALQAIRDLDAQEFQNRRLKVNEAKPRNASQKVFNSFSSNFGYKDRHTNF